MGKEKTTEAVGLAPDPLSLSERRERLEAEGYEFPDGDMGYARRVIRSFVVDGKLRHEYHFAVPIPGDPGYKGVINELSQVSQRV